MILRNLKARLRVERILCGADKWVFYNDGDKYWYKNAYASAYRRYIASQDSSEIHTINGWKRIE